MKEYIVKSMNKKGRKSYHEFTQSGYWDKNIRLDAPETQEELSKEFINLIIAIVENRWNKKVLWIYELNDECKYYNTNE